MTSTKLSNKLTLAEFLQFPETKPASEYIDGQIYQKPMPQGKHSAIQTFLASAIDRVAIPIKTASAFTELRCTFGGRSIVPDISVFTWQRIPLDANGEIENTFSIHPDWVIEILSPEQSSTRVIDNILFCLNAGTELGWLIDAEEKIIMVFRPGKQPETKENQDNLPVLSSLEDLQLSAQDVFSWLSLN
ncbi:Uma2 family endonuclease [Planktothrix sp. FACHB-1355]|uniref:Uma2 family endonuclease n=1 Tax=Aerosakkonema funiforme FACHB-1375 TaxID=2949571 RepID=A0A926ZGV9_9CYAN|nr:MULTISPECIES: Uma2 family endonuclease [Oscillatoriales]MBD2182390.1 Uma2 family endonuclease [Aerosakkonema funiforme FACHB-1375]MBD3559254.1 Uma2 family endonuclease [Planktothrix sp. FACHB-1355]